MTAITDLELIVNGAVLDWLVARIDDQIAAAAAERRFLEKPGELEFYQQSKAQLLKIRAAGGQPAPEGSPQ